jgi:anti-sigma factor RsiW
MTPCATRFEPLNAYVDGELGPAEELDLRRHLDVCESCRAEVDGLLALKEAVARSAEVRPVPHTLRERLATLDQPHARRRVGRLMVLAALAAGVLIAVGVTRLADRARHAKPPDRVIEALVADHLHFLQVADAVELDSDDPAEIAAWFADKVAFPVRVPQLRSATLLGGRLCSLWGQKVALAFYDVRGKRASLFALDPATAPARPHPTTAGCTAALGDYRVCFIPTPSALLAMVADESQTAAVLPELEALAARPPLHAR